MHWICNENCQCKLKCISNFSCATIVLLEQKKSKKNNEDELIFFKLCPACFNLRFTLALTIGES